MNTKRILLSIFSTGLAVAAVTMLVTLLGLNANGHLAYAGTLARPVAALPPETLYQGTEIAALTSHDDSQACSIPVGFTFSFYGANQTQLCTTNNGFVTFDPGGSSVYVNQPLTYTSGGPTTMIAAFWDDLMSYGPKQPVLYKTIGSAPNQEFILQWTNYGFFSSQLPMGTFQIILYEGNNNIRFQYRQLLSSRSTGNSATVGVRNSSSMYRQYSYNTASLTPTQSILWTWNGSNYDYDASAAYEGVYLYKTTPPPAIPQLAAPANNGTASTTPAFSWSTADRTVTYTLKVANEADTAFNAPIVNVNVLSPTTSYAYGGGGLTMGNKYIWAVVAANAEGDTWSEVWKFTMPSAHTLTVNTAGTGSGSVATYAGGTLLLPPDRTFPPGTVVTLTAVPSTTSVFAGWSGAASGAANPVTVTMDANKVVTATFDLSADLSVTENVLRTANAITYTIVTQNIGPGAADGAVVSSTFPAEVANLTWACVGSGGAACGASSGTAFLPPTINPFPSGGIVTYTVRGTLGLLDLGNNVVTVTPPSGVVDPNLLNNRAEYKTYQYLFPLVFKNAP